MERRGVALGSAALLAGPLFALFSAFGLAAVPAAITAVIAVVTTALVLAPRLPATLDGSARAHPYLAAIWIVVVLAGASNIARVSTFMADPAQQDHATLPYDEFSRKHNCLTAYFRAGQLSKSDAENLYDPVHYWSTPDDPDDSHRMIGPFPIDLYEYPPPFLVPVRAALAVTDDFATIRAGWFALDALLFAAALLALAIWIGETTGKRVAMVSPAVFAAIPVLATLQMGNFQLAAYSIAILAMIAVERRRPALGGALLAFVILCKVFPGVLAIDLLVRKRYRALAWTCGFGAAFLLISVALVGWAPFSAFVHYQLPRMASGEAFPFLTEFPPAAAANHSIFGIVLKLHVVGVPGMSMHVASLVAWGYTAIVVGLIAWLARRPPADRLEQGLRWLAIIQLGALRSPFTPDVYAVLGPLWMLALLAVRAGWVGRAACIAAWVALTLAIALLSVEREMGIELRLVLTGIGQVIGIAITIVALRPRCLWQRRSVEVVTVRSDPL